MTPTAFDGSSLIPSQFFNIDPSIPGRAKRCPGSEEGENTLPGPTLLEGQATPKNTSEPTFVVARRPATVPSVRTMPQEGQSWVGVSELRETFKRPVASIFTPKERGSASTSGIKTAAADTVDIQGSNLHETSSKTSGLVRNIPHDASTDQYLLEISEIPVRNASSPSA